MQIRGNVSNKQLQDGSDSTYRACEAEDDCPEQTPGGHPGTTPTAV